MKYYLYKLLPPRPTFPGDITPAEVQLMQEHSAYWRKQMAADQVIAFGPVADPRGAYGIAILHVENGADSKALADMDPVIVANRGFSYEIHPMPSVVHVNNQWQLVQA